MRAIVSEVKFNGLVLRIEDGTKLTKEAWLPAGEWSKDPSNWEKEKLSIEENYELDVVSLSSVIDGRTVVSRKSVHVISNINSAHNLDLIRDMKVKDVARTLIRGTIGDGSPAIVTQKYYQSYIDWIASKELSHELLDHAVLGRGDVIRGFVVGISNQDADELASAVLDISSYLDFKDAEISQEVTSSASRIKEDQEEDTLPDKKIPSEIVAKISPVLLVDDNDQCRESIATMLKREGVEVDTLKNVHQAQAFLDTLSANPTRFETNRAYQLAILDPNLEEDSTDLFGLYVADELRAKTDCRVILMTGEIENSKKLAHWPKLGIHGYIAKPFTMGQLIEEIQAAYNNIEPMTLAEMVKLEERDLPRTEDVVNTRSSREPGEISISEALQQLGRLKPGTILHVFSLHPRSFRARSEANWGGSINWEPLRGKLAKSVIKDTAVDRVHTLELNATHNHPRHLWTQRMVKYKSFCGIPVYVKGKRAAVVAFHPERDAFNEQFVMTARLTAEQVGRAMEREALYSTRLNEAELASFGMALASLAHELASDMTALDANLKELRDLTSENLDDLSKKSEALKALVRVRKDVDVISTKTRILRGAQARSDRVSIIDCLKQAATACRTVIGQDMKNAKRNILIDEVKSQPESWDVTVPAASLIIVFFNLYLNAAQQIDLASKVRKQGRIWHTLLRFHDAKGKAWARVRIHDSGPGIHYDEWEQVFEPGYTTKPNGSGLGLYICRYLLRDLSASLTITSSGIWDGTTVTVNLPLVDEKAKT
jgi:signal transduction histidine kinase/DNA-binding response OmpR family regulator